LKGIIKDIFTSRRHSSKWTIEEDNYLKRLRASVIGEGMLHKGNLYWFDYVIKRIPNNCKVLEIGSYAGLSACAFLHLCHLNNKTVQFYNCDPWIYEGYEDHIKGQLNHIDGRADVSRSDYAEYIKSSFINAMRLLSKDNLPHSFQLYSDDFFQIWGKANSKIDLFNREIPLNGSFDYVYIDGDHSYEQAKLDLRHSLDHLNTFGYILLDDSADYMSFGSARLMKDVKKMKGIKIIGKNPNYLLQKK